MTHLKPDQDEGVPVSVKIRERVLAAKKLWLQACPHCNSHARHFRAKHFQRVLICGDTCGGVSMTPGQDPTTVVCIYDPSGLFSYMGLLCDDEESAEY